MIMLFAAAALHFRYLSIFINLSDNPKPIRQPSAIGTIGGGFKPKEISPYINAVESNNVPKI